MVYHSLRGNRKGEHFRSGLAPCFKQLRCSFCVGNSPFLKINLREFCFSEFLKSRAEQSWAGPLATTG